MDYIIALAPSVGIGLLGYLIIRSFLTADRRERAAETRFRAEIAEQLRKESEI